MTEDDEVQGSDTSLAANLLSIFLTGFVAFAAFHAVMAALTNDEPFMYLASGLLMVLSIVLGVSSWRVLRKV